MSVSRVDHAVLQLRAQLQRLARERSARAAGSARPEQRPLERLRPSAAAADGEDEQFRRAFVRALLTEELGEGLANEAEFERIANEVWRLLDGDVDTRSMMNEAIARLR